jgi:hypothetical protein
MLVFSKPARPTSPTQASTGSTTTISMKVLEGGVALAKEGTFAGHTHGWQQVRRKVWRKKTAATAHQCQPRCPVHERFKWHAGVGKNPVPLAHDRGSSKLGELFKKRVAGRCFWCLASDHLVVACRDSLRCLRCLASGHRARRCCLPPRAAMATEVRPPPASAATPPQPPPAMSQHRPLLHDRPKLGLQTQRADRIDACAPTRWT